MSSAGEVISGGWWILLAHLIVILSPHHHLKLCSFSFFFLNVKPIIIKCIKNRLNQVVPNVPAHRTIPLDLAAIWSSIACDICVPFLIFLLLFLLCGWLFLLTKRDGLAGEFGGAAGVCGGTADVIVGTMDVGGRAADICVDAQVVGPGAHSCLVTIRKKSQITFTSHLFFTII